MNLKGQYLIFGSDGFLGQALADHLMAQGEPVIGTTCFHEHVSDWRFYMDLNEPLGDWRPPAGVTAAFLFAALPKIAACAKDPAGTARLNVDRNVELAQRLSSEGVFAVFPSTNLVFDGTRPLCQTDDPPSPRVEYGRQKALAESLLAPLGSAAGIMRFTKIVGPHMALPRGWIESLKNNQIIEPFSDMFMSPVSVDFVVEALHRMAQQRHGGILHVSGARDISYAEAAAYLAQRLGADPALVRPVRRADTDAAYEHNPRHTSLDTTSLREHLGLTPPTVWEALDTILDK